MNINNTSITRRLDAVINGLEAEFRSIYDVADFERAIVDLKNSAGRSDHPSKLKRLYNMFKECGIEYKEFESDNYYEELVASANIPSFRETEDRFLLALFNSFKSYPSPEDYIKRIVDRLCDKNDHWENDTLRLRILKQFIKYGNYLQDAGCGGKRSINRYAREHGAYGKNVDNISCDEVLSHLDDDVFNVLPGATKDQKSFDGKYGLLKTADDLAKGKFRVEGATKKSLYLFAMVYNMTYFVGEEQSDRIYDPKSDIEKNLFQDYYTNNFVRFITEEYKDRKQEFEADPSGQGINYKNFAEIVYIYYISQNMSAVDKIKESASLIEEIRKDMLGKGVPDTWVSEDDFSIVIDKERINSEDLLNRTRDELKSYLCSYFYCDTSKAVVPTENAVSIVSPLMLESGQESAFEEYQMILEGIKSADKDLKHCNYGLWFTDVATFRNKGYKTLCDRCQDIDPEEYKTFMELLLAVNDYVGKTVNEEKVEGDLTREHRGIRENRIPSLSIDSADAVTRSSIVTAFYYYYNALHIGEDIYGTMSFAEVFNDFKKEVDEFLEAAGYQLFSGKNLLDVLLAFSSYTYIYM